MNGAPDPNKLRPPTPDEVRQLGNRVDQRIDADPNELDVEVSLVLAKSIAIIAMLRLGVESGAITPEELEEQTARERERIETWIKLETEISLEALRRKVKRDGTI